ncbi:hypothetical protein PROFUN_07552 [Planoprotostelium fungivorum]|uniref:Uncharacterized protein n=1 Tax=Planoprotostelium fungivorum TaxID=1890364 RepID=A0A2P6NLW3_9EUKA|nr:hypothetical protein PROFUN_07552 [Planoprotostelium fungivorum]
MGDANTAMRDRTRIHRVVAFVSHCRIGVNRLQMVCVATLEESSLLRRTTKTKGHSLTLFQTQHMNSLSPAEHMTHVNKVQSEKMTVKNSIKEMNKVDDRLGQCQNRQNRASTGNRTRVSRVAGGNSTTGPSTLVVVAILAAR